MVLEPSQEASGRFLQTAPPPPSGDTVLLNQALEVGNVILKITDLEKLLASAVEIIQTRFNVYHVQVYMTEKSGKTLTSEPVPAV